MINKSITILLLLFFSNTNAQNILQEDSLLVKKENLKISYKQLIIPAALMTYGLVSLESNSLTTVNANISEEVSEHIDEKISIDDFSQYTPLASVYLLNNIGIEGKHNLKDRSIILASSFLLMSGSVTIIKNTGTVIRPDRSSNNSFPSGHTATAFMGATFLWEEYKDVSLWYGISGYLVATGTGVFRVLNNRHWLSDIAMGAGIGILSTKIAYWIFPVVDKLFFKGREHKEFISVAPFYNGKQTGLAFGLRF